MTKFKLNEKVAYTAYTKEWGCPSSYKQVYLGVITGVESTVYTRKNVHGGKGAYYYIDREWFGEDRLYKTKKEAHAFIDRKNEERKRRDIKYFKKTIKRYTAQLQKLLK